MKKHNTILAISLAIMLLFIFSCVLTACTSTKDVSKKSESIDSTVLKEKNEEIRILLAENEKLNAEINKLQYSMVEFDSTKCPPSQLIIDKNCNVDSIKQILEKHFQNQVKIYADGTIEAKGNLRSANFKLIEQIRLAQQKSRQVDSLSKAIATEKANVKKALDEKKKEKKVSFLPWWIWLLCTAGFVGGVYVGVRYRNFFTIKSKT